jgi:hypothetical protein
MKIILWVCFAVVIWKCKFVKTGSEIRESHDLRTHLNRKREITDNLNKIWMIKSWGTYSVSFFSTPLPLVIYQWMRKYKNGECEKLKS